MKNTFRSLKAGDIVFALVGLEIEEAMVTSTNLQQKVISQKNGNNHYIIKDNWDKISHLLSGIGFFINHDTALIHQYKAHRIEIEKSLNAIQLHLGSVRKNLQKTADIMVELVNVNDSIDWNITLKKE